MSRTHRWIDTTPEPPRVRTGPITAEAVRLLALCHRCGGTFAPTGRHVDTCHACQTAAERRAYRRTDRRMPA